MDDLRITVTFETEHPGFHSERPYEVLRVEDGKFLMINDDGHFAHVDCEIPTAVTVDRAGDRLFDLQVHRFRQRLENLAGKRVVFTTWEHIGFDPDETTDENMLLYRGVVESYDGETLFLRRHGDEHSRFGILPRAIATLDEET